MRGVVVLAIVLSGLAISSCGDGESTDSATLGAAPFHVVSTDAVMVTGTATCRLSGEGTNPEGGSGLLAVCELDLSDPRVSGTETTDRYRYFIPDPTDTAVGDVWVADAVLTNGEGTWRGAAQAADDTTPCGETYYVGEGAFDGLEFRYYFCHVDEPAQVRGWIQSSQ